MSISAATFDPSKRLDLYFRRARDGGKKLTFLQNGSAYDISAIDFKLNIKYKSTDSTNVLQLTTASGLTVGGAGNNELTISVTDTQSTIKAVTYYWELFNGTDDKTWLNGDFIVYTGNRNDITESTSLSINLDPDTIIVQISEAGLTSITSSDVTTALGYTPENVQNKSTDVNLGTSNTLYPTQNAVKTYVDANAGGGTAADVTFTPAGNIEATNVQTAIQEVDTEKAAKVLVIREETDNHVLEDADFTQPTEIQFNKATAITLTVPDGLTIAAGAYVFLRRVGAGQLSLVESGSQNITPSLGALTDPGEDALMTLTYQGSNEWYLDNGTPVALTLSDIEGVTGYQWVKVSKGTNQTFNAASSAYADITGLSFPIVSGVLMEYRFRLLTTTANVTEGYWVSVNGPALTKLGHSAEVAQTSSTIVKKHTSAYDTSTPTSASVLEGFCLGDGMVQTSADGTVILRMSVEGNSINVVVLAGSYIEYRRAVNA